MSNDRQSIPVSLPPELVFRLDRLVVRQEHLRRLHEHADTEAREEVKERLNRKRARDLNVVLAGLDVDR